MGARRSAHVFDGDGFGVGLTVQPVDAPAPGPVAPAPQWHPARLGELMPVATRGDAGLAAEIRRANIAEARLWAYRVELVAQLALKRGAARDREGGRSGGAAPGWAGSAWAASRWVLEKTSEFLPDELALIMNCSRAEATGLAVVALTLARRLPVTWAALADGELSWSRARAIAEEVARCGPDVDEHAVSTAEAVVVPQAAELSSNRLRALVRTEVVRRDGKAADQRRARARAAADVFLRRADLDGMTDLVVRVPHEVGVSMLATIDEFARQAALDGDARSIGLVRAEVAADLVLRPWDLSRPPVTAVLRISAPLNSLLPDPAVPSAGGTPTGVALVDEEPVTAAHLRALLTALDAVCPGGLQAPSGGALHVDVLGGGGGLLATSTRRELADAVRRGCPAHPDGSCACSLAGPPPATTGYRPTASQRRWTAARDGGCRHPGCRSRSGWADIDHVVPHAEGGATDCANLCCLCRRHHRLKTHAPGWTFTLDPDGALLVTTPSGVTRVTRPPGSLLMEPYEFGAPLPDVEYRDVPPF